MRADVLLNLLNQLRKRDEIQAYESYLFFATSLINSIIQMHTCKIIFIT